MSDKSRIGWIDIAKGICMISVIAGHLGVTEVNDVVFAFHLTLFFILSGFTLKPELSAKSAAKRFSRLMTPYFVTCTLVALMEIVNLAAESKTTETAVVTASLFKNIARGFFGSGALQTIGPYKFSANIGAIWFLPAMFFATVITQLFLSRITNIKWRYALSIGAAAIASIAAQYFWLPFSILSGVFAVPFIMLGYDARQAGLFDKIRLPHFAASLGVFVIGYILKLTSVSFVTASMPDFILTPIFALSSCVCIVYISQKCAFLKPFAFVGKYSMYYLCSHLFELQAAGYWQIEFLKVLGLPLNKGVLFVLRVIFDTLVVLLILGIKRLFKNIRTAEGEGRRDLSIDVAKALLIILMIAGHFEIDRPLRNFIYSFHMPAFILLSGYLFKPEACKNLKKSILRAVKTLLLPYAAYSVIFVIIRGYPLVDKIKSVLVGMSLSRNILTDIKGIGPCYFLLLLFAVRVLYLVIAKICRDNDLYTSGAVTVLSVTGMLLGKGGLWLPWSFDAALYSLILYHIGYLLKKHGVIEYICSRPYYYFALACGWAYLVYIGGIELAIRNYASYGIAVIGCVCACIIVYMLSRYVYLHFPRAITKVLCAIGENTLYILIIHTLWGVDIERFAENYLGLTPTYIYHLVASVAINVLLGVAIGLIIKVIKNGLNFKKRTN